MISPTLSPASRFSNRAENYVKYRPGYPDALFNYLENSGLLIPGCLVADIGSGTGLFAEPLLKRGYVVIGIEPNKEMRLAGEARLSSFLNFSSRNQCAEDTGLRSKSIHLITAAQAFHWFDPALAKKEFQRILHPEGQIALAWNLPDMKSKFMESYHALKERYRVEDHQVYKKEALEIVSFFDPLPVYHHKFANEQWLDFDGLKGQLLSSSYIPLPGYPMYDTMIAELVQLFVRHNKNGFVRMDFETMLYTGTFSQKP